MIVKVDADNTFKPFLEPNGEMARYLNITIANDQAGAADLIVQHGSAPSGQLQYVLAAGKAAMFPMEQGDELIHVKLASGSGPVAVIGITGRHWRTD